MQARPALQEVRSPVRTAADETRPVKTSAPARSEVRRVLFVLADALAAAAAVLVTGGVATAAAGFVAAVVLIDALDRRRAHRLNLSALDEAPGLALRGLVIAGIIALAGMPVSIPLFPGTLPGAGWLVTALVFAVLAVAIRSIGYAVLRRLQADGRLTSPALIVGTGSVGRIIGRRLQEHPEYGLVAAGYVDTVSCPPASLPAPVVGEVTALPRLIAKYRAHHVFVAFGRTRDVELVDLLRACDRLDCEIFVVPRLFELGVAESSAPDHLWGVPLIRLHRTAFRSYAWGVKRILDIVLAAGALVLLSPVMLVIALALRGEVGPQVFFRQIRVGLDGRPFELVKFRTLRSSTRDDPAEFCVVSPDRLGPVGRFLRRSSLDELPQFWNVLRGQMSIVGPRPEQSHFARRFAGKFPRYRHRLRVPAGVTGLAQVNDLRGAGPIDERVCLDNFYIEHWSLWQDIKILVRTVASVLRMRGR